MSVSSIGGFNTAQIEQFQKQMFQRADADKSGGISLDEFGAAGVEKSGKSGGTGIDPTDLFSRLDADGNGELNEAELKPPAPPSSALSSSTLASLLDAQEASGTEKSETTESAILRIIADALDAAAKSRSETKAAEAGSTVRAEDDATASADRFSDVTRVYSVILDALKSLSEGSSSTRVQLAA